MLGENMPYKIGTYVKHRTNDNIKGEIVYRLKKGDEFYNYKIYCENTNKYHLLCEYDVMLNLYDDYKPSKKRKRKRKHNNGAKRMKTIENNFECVIEKRMFVKGEFIKDKNDTKKTGYVTSILCKNTLNIGYEVYCEEIKNFYVIKHENALLTNDTLIFNKGQVIKSTQDNREGIITNIFKHKNMDTTYKIQSKNGICYLLDHKYSELVLFENIDIIEKYENGALIKSKYNTNKGFVVSNFNKKENVFYKVYNLNKDTFFTINHNDTILLSDVEQI